MGTTPSVEIYSPSTFKYFSIQFGHSDRLRLIAAPFEVINKTKTVLTNYWHIQNIHESPGFVEFKIEGMPWLATRSLDVNVKYFLCNLIKDYYEIGWHLKISSDLKYYGSGSDVVIFERINPISTFVICLSLNDTDKIRVLAPEDIIPYIRTAIMSFWPQGIQREQKLDKSFEFKLKGNPWGILQSDGIESFYGARLINGILSSLYNIGWVFVSAIDSGNREYDLNSLYFRYDPTETSKPENLNSRFFALTLNRTDRVRLINALPDLIMNLKSAMLQLWPYGIQKEKNENFGYEFKLKGNPWYPHSEETVTGRALVSNLMTFFSQFNWNLYATCVLTMSVSDKSSFFFRYCEQKPSIIHCMSLNETDKIRFIGDYQLAVERIRNAINQSWKKGIQNEKLYYGSWEFKLKGNPFTNYGSDNIYACYLMMNILGELESMGFKIISSSDVSGKNVSQSHGHNNGTHHSQSYHSVDLDTWFLAHKY